MEKISKNEEVQNVDEEMPPASKEEAEPSAQDSDEEREYESLEERMTVALSYKDSGNVAFKNGENLAARDHYKNGLKLLKSVEGEDLQMCSELKKSLALNLAAVHLRLFEWFDAVAACNDALKLDPENVKGLYRRGVAYSENGHLDEAKKDMVRVIAADQGNNDAKVKLNEINKRIANQKIADKKVFGGMFSNMKGGLYADREAEARARKEREEEAKRRSEEAWKKDNEERKERGEEPQTFEEWEKANQPKEEPIPESKPADDPPPPKRTAPSTITSEEMEDELDDEDRKIIEQTKSMGYCYFRKELTEEEKQLKAANVPQKLSAPGPTPADNAPKPMPAAEQSISSWNAKGTTYEEKDVTDWGKKKFSEYVASAKVSNRSRVEAMQNNPAELMESLRSGMSDSSKSPELQILSAAECLFLVESRVRKVRSITGDAHMAVVRGTRRLLFDFQCVIEWAATVEMPLVSSTGDEAAKKREYTGELNLHDVSSSVDPQGGLLHDSRLTYKKEPLPQHSNVLKTSLEELKAEIARKIEEFIEEGKKL